MPYTAITLEGEYELEIYPDCAGELVEVPDDEALVDEKPLSKLSYLTFIAIGRANWDHEIVRGLLLVQNGKEYRRVGYFQVRSNGLFSVENWSVETLRIV